jgi:hypothetical protein
MNSRKDQTGTDTVIFICFFLAFVFWVISGPSAHTQLSRIAVNVITVVLLLSIFGLPVWVVGHIIFQKRGTARIILWTESILAGAWVTIGICSMRSSWTGCYLGLFSAVTLGIAVGLAPGNVAIFRTRVSGATK